MKNMLTSATEIDKKHVTAMAMFAIRNIPTVNGPTLNKFLELMNTDGGFGSITIEQLLEIMRLVIKYVPNTCGYSLLVLIELLGLHLPLMKDKYQTLDLPALPAQRQTSECGWQAALLKSGLRPR